ncbi:hypothetical protein ABIB82_001576 [Bradyrhizobium sp. i1.8.4]|uniref:hypothetical protein n=1 Tax=unclassified Bradyrhizobium TaxID=2631580 RepID=UPI003D1CA25A
MRSFVSPSLLLTISVLVLAFATDGIVSAAQAQSAPIEQAQTPQQADQARGRDRSRAEDVKIGRDWKAQGGEDNKPGRAEVNKDHETVGQDWRAHPANPDH